MDFGPHQIGLGVNKRRRSGDVAWNVDPAWEAVLLDEGGLRWQQWARDGSIRVIKDGPHRTVYRIDLPQISFFLKHYRCAAMSRAGRHLIRPSASRREFQRAHDLVRRRIPTVRPVAVGEQYRHGLVHDSFFISDEVADSVPLDEFAAAVLPRLAEGRRHTVRRHACVELAALCARMHTAGVVHDDFHAGNILIRVDPSDDTVRLTLIDLPGVRCHRRLSRNQSFRSLIMLGSGLLSQANRSERWRFWCAYLERRAELTIADPRAMAAKLDALALARSRRVVRSRDRRALRTNRDYFGIVRSAYAGHAVRGLSERQLSELIDDPEALLRRYVVRPAKLTHRTVVVRAAVEVNGQQQPIAWKRFREKNGWKSLLARLRPSRARRERAPQAIESV